MILIDTTFLIDLLKGRIGNVNIKRLENEGLCTTTLNIYEVLLGVFHSSYDVNKGLDAANTLFSRLNILNTTKYSVKMNASIRADLMKKGQDIDDMDCLISGIALENGVNTILTKSKKHFERIPGIKVEEY